MSLLLEALKKAEKAKEEAERRARAERREESRGLSLEDEAPPGRDADTEAKTVLTRAELPDIRQPLEIVTDDIAPPEPPIAPVRAAAASAPQRATPNGDTVSEDRAAAKAVFEAKFREPNPRLPFYVALAMLGVLAIGTVGYFWYQLRPRPALVNTNPPRTGNEASKQLAVSAPVTIPTAAPAPASQPAIPGLPESAPVRTKAVDSVTASPQEIVAPPKKTTDDAAPAAQRKAAAPAPQIRRTPANTKPAARTSESKPLASAIQASRPAPRVHPKVQAAYEAYIQGDLAAARDNYEAALREEPSNRDALLGLASVEVRARRFESAEALYLRLLQLDPRDTHAQAGLIALRSSRLDPLATESRVKNMLAADPEADVLNFALGNQLARQGRWSEAQQEYFKAFAAAPNNPDFAYNLAVSLDHLRKQKLALEYYQRAIALAGQRPASFDIGAARLRAEQLAK